MGRMRESIIEAKEEQRRFSPAGQSTQMIVGADDASDETVLSTSASLYETYRLRRVYYSAFSPIPEPSIVLPLKAPPLQRENRLYQADWLLRYYGFSVLRSPRAARAACSTSTSIRNSPGRSRTGICSRSTSTRAEREILLRVPGLGKRAVDKILAARRHTALRLDDIARLSAGLKRARPFLVTPDHRP